MQNGILICQGYIYFYVDIENKQSSYIGSFVKPEYRNQHLASILTSAWIEFCLDNDITNLCTNKSQRKPFLIYMLKQFNFELEHPEFYEAKPYAIQICQKEHDLTKYLQFKSPLYAERFTHSSIFTADNYQIISPEDTDYSVLDSVILSQIYNGQDNEQAYNRAERILKQYR